MTRRYHCVRLKLNSPARYSSVCPNKHHSKNAGELNRSFEHLFFAKLHQELIFVDDFDGLLSFRRCWSCHACPMRGPATTGFGFARAPKPDGLRQPWNGILRHERRNLTFQYPQCIYAKSTTLDSNSFNFGWTWSRDNFSSADSQLLNQASQRQRLQSTSSMC